MPSHNKTPTVVVRPLARGAQKPTKVVLATLQEQNHHAPLEEITQHLTWWYVNEKPWKQANEGRCRFSECKRSPRRRNAGRNDGTAYTSSRFVCGRELDSECRSDYEDELDERLLEDESSGRGAGKGRLDDEENEAQREARREVNILDIAKMARPRGVAKKYEVITVPSVIALEDDEWQWEVESPGAFADEDWETVEGGISALRDHVP